MLYYNLSRHKVFESYFLQFELWATHADHGRSLSRRPTGRGPMPTDRSKASSQSRARGLTISRKTMLGLAALSIMSVGAVAASLFYISQIEQKLRQITTVTAPIVRLSDELVDNTALATKRANDMLAEKRPAVVDAVSAGLRTLNQTFEEQTGTLVGMLTSDAAKEALTAAEASREQFNAQQGTARDEHIDELKARAAVAEQLEAFAGEGEALFERLKKLSADNAADMAESKRNADLMLISTSTTARDINKLMRQLFTVDYPMVASALKLQAIVVRMESVAHDATGAEAIMDVETQRTAFADLVKQAEPQFHVLRRNSRSDQEKAANATLREAFDAWVEDATGEGQLFDTVKAMLIAKAKAQAVATTLDYHGQRVGTALAQVADEASAMSAQADQEASQMVVTAQFVMIGLVAGIIVVSAAMMLLIFRTVIRPITGMTAAMDALATGRHETDVPAVTRTDEIGHMAKAVQVFKEGLIRSERLAVAQREDQARKERETARVRELITTFEQAITAVFERLHEAEEAMRATSQDIQDNAERTKVEAASVAGAADQASANVETVASAADELTSSIQEIARQVSQATDVSGQANAQADRTSQGIRVLEDNVKKISEIVLLINDIASQTNLLALNATIEAARAGDAGKGFAVVATEVKELASQTARATDEIGTQITQIQTSTVEAVAAINAITTVIREISAISSSISAAVEQQGAATQEIARNVQEAATGTQTVSASINDVRESAEGSNAVAGAIAATSAQVAAQTAALRQQVSDFLRAVQTNEEPDAA
ncbi:HAMP domain-containing protein [Roseospira marina]|uniref:HAMP domain-containing protein n=1 Tax=Roseospira marina TaxID=140057 RepID=A0A5M6I6I4_9PROT|nr:methyl-accepting chemotaxis protein [Roseospira marina]KAA5603851.1 HAMP domain-containing protein [Roseospira marina]MBB4313760.1 methyl-accepting chemotaxis protein [Roseospira marina]MBB5086922.1 methyl-accepting chemotaxis protein [Roseospira marina]